MNNILIYSISILFVFFIVQYIILKNQITKINKTIENITVNNLQTVASENNKALAEISEIQTLLKNNNTDINNIIVRVDALTTSTIKKNDLTNELTNLGIYKELLNKIDNIIAINTSETANNSKAGTELNEQVKSLEESLITLTDNVSMDNEKINTIINSIKASIDIHGSDISLLQTQLDTERNRINDLVIETRENIQNQLDTIKLDFESYKANQSALDAKQDVALASYKVTQAAINASQNNALSSYKATQSAIDTAQNQVYYLSVNGKESLFTTPKQFSTLGLDISNPWRLFFTYYGSSKNTKLYYSIPIPTGNLKTNGPQIKTISYMDKDYNDSRIYGFTFNEIKNKYYIFNCNLNLFLGMPSYRFYIKLSLYSTLKTNTNVITSVGSFNYVDTTQFNNINEVKIECSQIIPITKNDNNAEDKGNIQFSLNCNIPEDINRIYFIILEDARNQNLLDLVSSKQPSNTDPDYAAKLEDWMLKIGPSTFSHTILQYDIQSLSGAVPPYNISYNMLIHSI